MNSQISLLIFQTLCNGYTRANMFVEPSHCIMSPVRWKFIVKATTNNNNNCSDHIPWPFLFVPGCASQTTKTRKLNPSDPIDQMAAPINRTTRTRPRLALQPQTHETTQRAKIDFPCTYVNFPTPRPHPQSERSRQANIKQHYEDRIGRARDGVLLTRRRYHKLVRRRAQEVVHLSDEMSALRRGVTELERRMFQAW